MKKSFLVRFKLAAALMILMGAFALLTYGLNELYKQTLSPWSFLLYFSVMEITSWPLAIWAFFLMMSFPEKEKRRNPDWRQERREDLSKYYLIGLFATVVYLVIACLFPVSKRFGVIRVNDQRPSRIAYMMAVAKDGSSGVTRKVTISGENMIADSRDYSYRIRRKSVTNQTYFLAFQDEEASFQSFLANSMVMVYYERMERMFRNNNVIKTERVFEKEYEIEYYPNSGLIKSLDGCSPYDGKALNALVQEAWDMLVKERELEWQQKH